MYDIIIVGGGPAGLTAGIYAIRKKLNVLLISKDFVGQAGKAHLVENYPGFEKIGGLELIGKIKDHLEKFKIEIKEEEVASVKKKKDYFEIAAESGKYKSKAVIIASGRNPRPLQVPGEKEFVGKGVSYCSTCDAPVFAGKRVAVVGGGNAGFESALDLVKYAKKVHIFEFSSKPKADEVNQEKAKRSGKIEVFLNSEIKEIKGNNKVESIVFYNNESKKTFEMPMEGVFIEIGGIPATAFLKDLPIEFNKYGEIAIDLKTCGAKTSGIFAAGDVTDIKYKQIIVACGEGAKAALSAYDYVQNLGIKQK